MGLCKAVEIFHSRWHVTIVVTEMDGSKTTWIASADSLMTDNSGIWFGSEDEYKEDMKRRLGN